MRNRPNLFSVNDNLINFYFASKNNFFNHNKNNSNPTNIFENNNFNILNNNEDNKYYKFGNYIGNPYYNNVHPVKKLYDKCIFYSYNAMIYYLLTMFHEI